MNLRLYGVLGSILYIVGYKSYVVGGPTLSIIYCSTQILCCRGSSVMFHLCFLGLELEISWTSHARAAVELGLKIRARFPMLEQEFGGIFHAGAGVEVGKKIYQLDNV